MAPQITTTQIESMKPMARAAPIALSSLTDDSCKSLAPSYAIPPDYAMSLGRAAASLDLKPAAPSGFARHEGAAKGPLDQQSGVRQPQAEARHVPDQSRFRLRHVRSRGAAGNHLAQYGDTGATRRRHGVRGAGAGGALARIWRRH